MVDARMRRRGWFTLALMIGLAGLADAENAIKLSSDPNKIESSGVSIESAFVRPNVVQEVFVFVQNPIGDPKTLTVQLRDANGKAILAQGKVELKANEQKRVKLEKIAPPPPPKVAAIKDAVPKEPARSAAPAVEPPPGVELKVAGSKFEFQLWLLDGDKVLDKETRTISILVTQPGSKDFPIEMPQANRVIVANSHEINVPITANDKLRGGPTLVELIVPPQDSLNAGLRSGVYRRQIRPGQKEALLHASDLPFRGDDKNIRFYLNVDGLPRAFVFRTDLKPNSNTIDADTAPHVSVLPVSAERFVTPKSVRKDAPKYSVKPSEKTPVRIEVDNAPADATVELRFDHRDKGTFEGADVIVVGSARDERVFVDFQSEDGGIQVRYLVGDRIHLLDTRSLRGTFGVQAVMRWKEKKEDKEVKNHFYLVLDDTAPENGHFVQLPNRHVKGTLLTLKARADEPETSIRQAVFFVGEPAPDGKLPDVTAKGSLDKGVYFAKLPIPDKTGEIVVGVQFVNETGVTATETQKIELVDPPPPSGTIVGAVELGGRGQPGIVVSLRDGEGKEKGSAITENEDDNKPDTPKDKRKVNGKFRFDNVPPGTYRLVTAKPDSGVGTKGDAPAQVQIGKETKVTITLSRKP